MIGAFLIAVTLTFTNTDPAAVGFGILYSPAADQSKPLLYYRPHPAPGTTGPVTLDIPQAYAAGDCYHVAAIARGMSNPTNHVCISTPTPSAAEGLSVQP